MQGIQPLQFSVTVTLYNSSITAELKVRRTFIYGIHQDNLSTKVAIWPAQAVQLFLTSADVGAGARLSFAGEVIKTDGSKVEFIGTSNLDGGRATYFSTGTYRATRITQADDGSIWSVGAQHYEVTDAAIKKWANYDMLRRYTTSGTLVEHYLPRWGSGVAYVATTADNDGPGAFAAFDSRGGGAAVRNPNWGYRDAWKTSRQVFLRSAGSGVVLYDVEHEKLYRCNALSGVLSSQNVYLDSNAGFRVTGLAVSSDGLLIASLRGFNQDGARTSHLFELSSLPSGQSAFWSKLRMGPVAPSTLGSTPTLLGFDGNAIVYATGDDVAWSRINSAP